MFVIADAHISNNKEYNNFIKLIDKLSEHDKVILLGDILDFTKIEINKLDYNINDFDNENIIYVKGNHDIIVDELDIPAIDKYISDNKIVFEHGHRFEAICNSNFINTPEEYESLFRRLCYSKSNINNISWNIWKGYTKLKLYRKNKYELTKNILCEMSKRGNIICGHTHYELFDSVTNSLIVDDYETKKKIYNINEEDFRKRGQFTYVVHKGNVDETIRLLCKK